MFEQLSEREERILGSLAENPRLGVNDLAKIHGVSDVTIRSILNGLEDKAFFVRSHGGGFPAFHPAMLARIKNHSELKLKLAMRAADFIAPGMSVMLVGGTTTSFIPRFLLGKSEIKIVTNSTLLLPYARINPRIDFIFTGGDFRPEIEEMVGPIAIRELRQFHVDAVFTGIDGYTEPDGLTADTTEIAEIVQTMVAQSDRTVIVTDSSKFMRKGIRAHDAAQKS